MIPYLGWIDPASALCGALFLLFLQLIAVLILWRKYVKNKPDPEGEDLTVKRLIEEYGPNAEKRTKS